MVVRLAWTCLVYNFVVCVQLVLTLELNFFTILNFALLCLSNGGSIFVTIAAYKRTSWLHAISPFIMLTQLCFCLQPQLFELPDSTKWLLQGSMLVIYCLAMLVLVTKWLVQALIAFTIC